MKIIREDENRLVQKIINEIKYKYFIIIGITLYFVGIYLIIETNIIYSIIFFIIGTISVLYGVLTIKKNRKNSIFRKQIYSLFNKFENNEIDSYIISSGLNIDKIICNIDSIYIRLNYYIDDIVYISCVINKIDFSFKYGIELSNELYEKTNEKQFEEIFDIETSHFIDDYEEFKIDMNSNISIIINGIKEYYDNHLKIIRKITKIAQQLLK